MTAAEPTVEILPDPATSSDYLGLSVEQRYRVVSQYFPPWLLSEPIEFPPHHDTYGWACRVEDCDGALPEGIRDLICPQHSRQYRAVRDSVDLDEFVRGAEPVKAWRGRALSRRPDCAICGSYREAEEKGYCQSHGHSLRMARRRGVSEARWRQSQHPLPPLDSCSIPGCVHDATETVLATDSYPRPGRPPRHGKVEGHRVCDTHEAAWRRLKSREAESPVPWEVFLASDNVKESVTPADWRGRLSISHLPQGLQNEIRYALHRWANTERRSRWWPVMLQKVVDTLAAHGVTSLADPLMRELTPESRGRRNGADRRIWVDLPFAARSLMLTEDAAKAAGLFDPILVGGSPFPGAARGNDKQRSGWDLTAVSQRWLRDVLWEHLRYESLKPTGKIPGSTTARQRVTGITFLSRILRQNRDDGGEEPARLGRADAIAIKDTWDLWFREQIPIPTDRNRKDDTRTLSAVTRHRYMQCIRMVLQSGHEQRKTPTELVSFIFSLPDYPIPKTTPRPRPLSDEHYKLLVSAESIAALEALDPNDAGIADIWLTHAVQGGRIRETLSLRLGCIGKVGNAQPYLWRDISKVNVIDYGMPCNQAIYQKLQRRQEKTRVKLRARYAEELAALDERARRKLEAQWDRDKPLFPGPIRNRDLALEISTSGFHRVLTEWIERLGLNGVTTHQTRATLATSLLNNGAPAALVRQMLGHMSEESLAHYARYTDDTMQRHLQQVWAAGPGMDKPGNILLRPTEVKTDDPGAAAARIDLSVVPVEHGLCRYGPVVGGAQCPFEKNCSTGPNGPCEHFVLTGADLAYWERKRDAAYHFAEGAPNDQARDYILSQWHPWEPVLTGLREALDELGLLTQAEQLDLRAPRQDYFHPLFATGFQVSQMNQPPEAS
ncbi:MAG: tyrosine-type recombinase/integrase [Actinomycetia bacterium]|nr:tyrosine-type recombinase/integrase [Actinomycetes bacterium]